RGVVADPLSHQFLVHHHACSLRFCATASLPLVRGLQAWGEGARGRAREGGGGSAACCRAARAGGSSRVTNIVVDRNSAPVIVHSPVRKVGFWRAGGALRGYLPRGCALPGGLVGYAVVVGKGRPGVGGALHLRGAG